MPYARTDIPGHFGRTFLIGGTAVAGGLIGTWMLMSKYKKREQAAGKNPYHEQIIAKLSEKTPRNIELTPLTPLNARYSDTPPAFPGKDHQYSGHMTIRDAKKMSDYSPAWRRQIPPPQRAQNDESQRVYTKSPDFAKNYEKTEKARQVSFIPAH